jgi:two-component system sensor histidine kinase BaeS
MHSNRSWFRVPAFLKKSMLIKLILVNILTVLLVLVVALLMVERGSAYLFMEIMDQFNIEPVVPTEMFVSKMIQGILLGGTAALFVGVSINYIVSRIWLKDLLEIRDVAKQIANGGHAKASVRTVDEIGQLAVAINQMSESLQQMKEQRRDLMVDVAHELRTPLTTMKGYLEGLHNGVMNPTPDVIRVLSKEVHRLQSLVESIHQLNVLEYTEEKVSSTPVEVLQLIEEMAMLFEPRFAENRISVRLLQPEEQPNRLCFVYGNRDLLAQVFYNLFENTWRYSLPGDEATVLADCAEDRLEVVIENRGDHLKPVDVSRIFDRFYRAERSRSRETGGLGIGLAIAKQAILKHGGTIHAVSEPGRFQIRIVLPMMGKNEVNND